MTGDEDGSSEESFFAGVEVGDARTTEARTITEADVTNFAGVSGDFNHIHTDAEAMADSGFGERIAHGALVFAVMTGLLWQSRGEAERERLRERGLQAGAADWQVLLVLWQLLFSGGLHCEGVMPTWE
jgi:acyl dehydratase